ncbi:hypothetical protein IAT40_005581 [Kwoniella sp. CBS 6097]
MQNRHEMGIGQKSYTPNPFKQFPNRNYPPVATTQLSKYERSIECLHQLCAFEHYFQRFFAILYGLKKASIRATFDLEYARIDWHHTPRSTEPLNVLSYKLHRITRSQRRLEHNVIPEPWLKAQIRMIGCPEIDGEAGLGLGLTYNWQPPGMYRSTSHTPSYPTVDLSAISFKLFSFPRGVDDVKSLGFNDSLTFDYTHVDPVTLRKEKRVLIGLGIARILNHSCRPNVEWSFENRSLRKSAWTLYSSASDDLDVMSMSVPISQTDPIRPGEELFAFYGEQFATKDW